MNCEDMENAQPWPVFVVSIDGKTRGKRKGKGRTRRRKRRRRKRKRKRKTKKDETYQGSDTSSLSDTRKQPGTRSSVVITEEARAYGFK